MLYIDFEGKKRGRKRLLGHGEGKTRYVKDMLKFDVHARVFLVPGVLE